MDLHNIQLDGTLESRALPPSPAAMARAAHAEGHSVGWMLVTLAWTLLFGVGMFATLDRRFDRSFDLNSGIWTIAGRNLNRDGFSQMRFGCYVSGGEFPRAQRDFYTGHPPLLSWMMAGWMRLFGPSNAATRSMPLAFTLINILLVYALARRALNPVAGFFAGALYSLMPMTAYFSQVINMEPFVMTGILGACLAYMSLIRSGKKAWWIPLLLCIALGCWMDWPMDIFAGILAAAHFLTRRTWRALGGASLMVITPLLVFAAFAQYERSNGGDFYEKVVQRFEYRAGLLKAPPEPVASVAPAADKRFGPEELLNKFKHPRAFRRWIVGLITPTAGALAALGLLTWRWWSRDLPGDRVVRGVLLRIILAGIITQAIYTAAFSEGATRHEYWQYFLSLPVALLAGGICAWALRRVMMNGVSLLAAVGMVILLTAAATPAVAWGPFSFRMGAWHDVPNPESEHGDFHFDYIEPLRTYSDPHDLILTYSPNLGTAVEWYADRMVWGSDKLIFTLEDLEKTADAHSQGRALYLWNPAAPPPIADRIKPLVKALEAKYPLYRAGPLEFFLLRGKADGRWERISPASKPG